MGMRKQYYPQVMYKGHNSNNWTNIMYMDVNGGKKFASSLEEAKRAIENTKRVWSNDTRRDDTFEIVATRIRVREVTDWELVEETK